MLQIAGRRLGGGVRAGLWARGADVVRRAAGSQTGGGETKEKRDLPDFNTSTDIDSHKLTRPTQPPPPLINASYLAGLAESTKGSLIPETLREMEADEEFQVTAKRLKEMGQKKLTLEEKKRMRRALDHLNVPGFLQFLGREEQRSREATSLGSTETSDATNGEAGDAKRLERRASDIMQINVGIYCNQACNHCHVESSPKRKDEMMDLETAERCIRLLAASPSVHTLDLTGGAPELNQAFRYLVTEARKLGKNVIDRCNLTVIQEPGQEDLVDFLAENQVQVIASLPCYSAKNVNLQRGKGVFDKSIHALVRLNERGYGKEGTGLLLDLVYNPLGAFLPPEQESLELKYKEELKEHFGIHFNSLYTMTNMPIKRFADFLWRRGELQAYMDLLVRNYNPDTVENLMCRNHVNISWTGHLFDCDFNQQLDLPVSRGGEGLTVWDINSTDDLKSVLIANDNHCFGCTAGMGSS